MLKLFQEEVKQIPQQKGKVQEIRQDKCLPRLWDVEVKEVKLDLGLAHQVEAPTKVPLQELINLILK